MSEYYCGTYDSARAMRQQAEQRAREREATRARVQRLLPAAVQAAAGGNVAAMRMAVTLLGELHEIRITIEPIGTLVNPVA